MADTRLFIGLLSGTSVDGIDCALVSIGPERFELLAADSEPYPAPLRERIIRLGQAPLVSVKELGETDVEVGQAFASAVNRLLARTGVQARQVTAVGSHGQTVHHKPGKPLPFTLQIGDPNTIALRTGIQTVADFRRKDMAAGGQGAPLAPLFHRWVFAAPDLQRVILNLGGISNISVLAPGQEYVGYDTGPANALMDYWIEKQLGKAFDEQGAWASSGRVVPALLDLMLDDPYFSAAQPKSTGREYFGADWLESRLQRLASRPDPRDVQATLLELTAVTVATEIDNQLSADQVLVCGGGAHNDALLGRLRELLPQAEIATTEKLGLHPDWVEAATFAWLASQRIDNCPLDTRSITGAERSVVLGGLYLPG